MRKRRTEMFYLWDSGVKSCCLSSVAAINCFQGIRHMKTDSYWTVYICLSTVLKTTMLVPLKIYILQVHIKFHVCQDKIFGEIIVKFNYKAHSIFRPSRGYFRMTDMSKLWNIPVWGWWIIADVEILLQNLGKLEGLWEVANKYWTWMLSYVFSIYIQLIVWQNVAYIRVWQNYMHHCVIHNEGDLYNSSSNST